MFCSEPGVEGMPGVVLEACAHGLPILARKAAPIEEIRVHYDRIAFLHDKLPAAEQLNAALGLPPGGPIAAAGGIFHRGHAGSDHCHL